MAAAQPLTDEQRALLDFMLAVDFMGRDVLVSQAQTVTSGGLSCDCGCPSFGLEPDRTLRRAEVKEIVPISAHGTAADGSPIEVLLFVHDGYLSELEVVWYGEMPPLELPTTEGLVISQWSDPDKSGTRRLLN